MAGSGVAGPNAGLFWGWLDGEAGWGTGGFNPNAAMLDALLMPEVISAALTAPPVGPTAGDRYIVAAAPTGAWAGQSKALAVYRGGAWVFYPPKKGWRVHDTASSRFLYYDGAAWVSESAGSPQDVSMFLPGMPVGTNALIARYVFARAIELPAALVGSQGYAGAAATGATTLVLAKNGANIGTVNFAAGAQVATFTLASLTAFAAGDRLGIFSPAALDATLADISLTFVGSRT